MTEGIQVTGSFIVGEIRKNKTETIRVTRALVNRTPYVFLQKVSSWDGKPVAPKPVGKPISLHADRINDLIAALESARDWLG